MDEGKKPGLRVFPHGLNHSHEVLRGAAGDSLIVRESGFDSFVWEPEDRRALDLELRLRLVSVQDTAAYVIPQARFKMTFGHGDVSWQIPPRPAIAVAGAVEFLPIIPARGLVFRLSARQLQIDVFNNVATQILKCNVSVQPQHSCCGPTPYVQLGQDDWLPMDAKEMRVRRPDGSVFAAATALIQFFSLNGLGVTAAIDPTTTGWSDFQPIPPQAASIHASVLTLMEYR